MASDERSLSSISLEDACSVECDTYNNDLNVKKRRRKRFLWNPNVNFRSRRKWRTKKSKVAEDSNESSTMHPHISTESGEHSYSLLCSRCLGSSRNVFSPPTNSCLKWNHIPFPLFSEEPITNQ